MKDIFIEIDATYGTRFREGVRVKKNQLVGFKCNKEVVSPISGRLKKITFEPTTHNFIIELKPANK